MSELSFVYLSLLIDSFGKLIGNGHNDIIKVAASTYIFDFF